ncbi:MAG: TetR/AcrR family transcriptional regulator, partial [Microthrixaceae bacterium]|nr:TetR/AcrR family transcriptional regulator [Microthrixaceae bacterium]
YRAAMVVTDTTASGVNPDTRERLLRAAAFLFARKGTSGVRNHEIHTLAGQRNESALHYHFGNRQNLVQAVIAQYDVFSGESADALPGDRPGLILSHLVERLASGLETPEGRDWLRVISELMARFSDHGEIVDGSDRATSLALRLAPFLALPKAVTLRRTIALLRFLTSQMAERASRLESGQPAIPNEDEFVDELVNMSLAMLTAPRGRGSAR